MTIILLSDHLSKACDCSWLVSVHHNLWVTRSRSNESSSCVTLPWLPLNTHDYGVSTSEIQAPKPSGSYGNNCTPSNFFFYPFSFFGLSFLPSVFPFSLPFLQPTPSLKLLLPLDQCVRFVAWSKPETANQNLKRFLCLFVRIKRSPTMQWHKK